MAKPFQLGGDAGWPGLNEQPDARAASIARVARHTLRDTGRLECRPGSGTALSLPSGPVRAAIEHTKQATGTKVLLAVAGTSLYRKDVSDTTPVLIGMAGGNLLEIPGRGGVQMIQDGTRTLILCTSTGSPPLPESAPFTPDDPEGPGVDPPAPDTGDPSGTVSVAASYGASLALDIAAGTDDSGAAPSRLLKMYDTAAHRTANGYAGMLPTYPRALGPNGADLFGYRADGLNPSTAQYGNVEFSDAAGNTSVVPFDGTTTAGTVSEAGTIPLVWDEDDPNVVHPLTLPAAPTITSIARTDYVDATFDRPMTGYTPQRTAGDLGASWTVTGAGLNKAEWASTPMGGVGLHVDTNTIVGDGTEQVYCTETAPIDLSAPSGLIFKAFTGGNEKTVGQHWALILAGQSGGVPDTWFEIPFTIPEAGKTVDVRVSLADIPSSAREAIHYWGFRWSNNVESVIWINRLRSYGGLEGEKEYALVLRETLLSGAAGEITLDSPESAVVAADAGTVGATMTLSFDAIPTGHEGLIYRRDLGTSNKFHYLTTVAAAGTSYADTTVDIFTNPVLVEGRAAVPVNATAIGLHHGRLCLATAGSLWLSSMGNVAEWFDRTVPMLPDLHALGLVTDKDGMRLEMSDAGAVRALMPLGVWTGADYVGDTLVMTDAWDVRLSGTTPDTFSLGYRRQGGVCGSGACGRDNAGRVLKVDPEGQVWALDTNWQPIPLSEALHDTLRALPDKGTWRLGYDAASECVILVAGSRTFLFSAQGIDEWTPGADGAPVALVARAGDDGGYLAAGTLGGRLRRLLDPSVASERGASYKGPEWTLPWWRSRPVGCVITCKGAATARVRLNGTLVKEWTVVSGRRVLFPPRCGETAQLEIELGAGAIVHSAILTVEGR